MTFTVYKLNHLGEEEIKYTAQVLERSANHICIRAAFSAETRDLGYMILKKGDIFTEWFYSNQWYNIFRIDDVDNGIFKGFYCNLTRPAIITQNSVKAEDLALDLFIHPHGETIMLDEDEYADLSLSDTERQQVQHALKHLKQRIQARAAPFNVLQPIHPHQGE